VVTARATTVTLAPYDALCLGSWGVARQLVLEASSQIANGQRPPRLYADIDGFGRPRTSPESGRQSRHTHCGRRNLLLWEDIRDIVLVGHSYGGMVVRHVADQLPDRVRSLVYLDAFIPENGKSLTDYLPDCGKHFRELARIEGDGWKVPPIPASILAVNAMDAAWVDRQCTMHPPASFEAAAHFSSRDTGATVGYILARGWDGPFAQFYQLSGQRGWWREELACGHDVMLDMPNELATLLQRA
jgi:pimeloyl-ACP methyl ester carboxylesterase